MNNKDTESQNSAPIIEYRFTRRRSWGKKKGRKVLQYRVGPNGDWKETNLNLPFLSWLEREPEKASSTIPKYGKVTYVL